MLHGSHREPAAGGVPTIHGEADARHAGQMGDRVGEEGAKV